MLGDVTVPIHPGLVGGGASEQYHMDRIYVSSLCFEGEEKKT